jgi:mercuric transport protein
MQTITLNAPDISCGHCVATVEKALGDVDGVVAVKADAETKDVNVTWDDDKTDLNAIAAALDEAGYPARQ